MADSARPISQELLDNLVRQVVQAVRPLRIILFGSAARGQVGPHSDLDVLVVMPDGSHRGQTAEAIYLGLGGIGRPTDVVVATLSDLSRLHSNPYYVIKRALEEGRELYRDAAR
jgi:predicted nucleotidyltransferase